VTLTVLKQVDTSSQGLILVEVPVAMARSSAGFSFVLPRESVGLSAETSVVPQVSLVDGSPLPSWLHYVPQTNIFEGTAVPDGGLPIQVLVKAGVARIVLLITEIQG
jgi:hypothetical protein